MPGESAFSALLSPFSGEDDCLPDGFLGEESSEPLEEPELLLGGRFLPPGLGERRRRIGDLSLLGDGGRRRGERRLGEGDLRGEGRLRCLGDGERRRLGDESLLRYGDDLRLGDGLDRRGDLRLDRDLDLLLPGDRLFDLDLDFLRL